MPDGTEFSPEQLDDNTEPSTSPLSDKSRQGSSDSDKSDVAPLDGVLHPPEGESEEIDSEEQQEENKDEEVTISPSQLKNQKMILLGALAGAGVFSLFYIIFAFVLMAQLPAVDGGGQGLRAFGNMFYGAGIVLALSAIGVLGLRFSRMEIEPIEVLQRLMRPGIAVVIMIGISVMVFMTINKEIPLPIDILEPRLRQNLTAPLTATFGTDSLKSVLRKAGLAPVKYRWDFNGDGRIDAETRESQVTTIYKKKGNYNIRLFVLVNNGKFRSGSTWLTIPNALFTYEPKVPILNQKVIFDIANVVSDPSKIESVIWDFNSDGTIDVTSEEPIQEHIFETTGTHQVSLTVQYKSGLQETYRRPITILEEKEQPFAINITTEGALKGSPPLGIVFGYEVEEGIDVRKTEWYVGNNLVSDEPSFTHIFETPQEHEVTLRVTEATSLTAEEHLKISVLESLTVRDLSVNGSPQPNKGRIIGVAPLEVKLTPETSLPFITFQWEQESASRVISHKNIYHAIYNDPGTYPLVLITTDAKDRSQRLLYEVIVNPPDSSIKFNATPPTGTVPLIVKFDASESFIPGKRITGFSWLFGDEVAGIGPRPEPQLLGSQVTHRYDKEGKYLVVMQTLTEEGVTYEARKTIVARAPTLDSCFYPSRTSGTAPAGVRFYSECSTGDIKGYLWDFGDGTTSDVIEEITDHVFSVPGTYTVSLEITDDKGNISFSSATITITSP